MSLLNDDTQARPRSPLAELAQLAVMGLVFLAAFGLAPWISEWAGPVLDQARAVLAGWAPNVRALALTGFILAILALGPLAELARRAFFGRHAR